MIAGASALNKKRNQRTSFKQLSKEEEDALNEEVREMGVSRNCRLFIVLWILFLIVVVIVILAASGAFS